MGFLKPSSNDSKIATSTLSWDYACDEDVTGWDKASEFIYATWVLDDTPHAGTTSIFKLQWRRVGGTFADVEADTEVCWGTATSLVDGTTPVTSTGGCQTNDVSMENEGDNSCSLPKVGAGLYGEAQWALGFGTGALDNQEYELQVYDISLSNPLGAYSATITTAAGSTTYNTSLASSLRVNATFDTSLTSNLRVKITDIQLSLPSQLKIILTSQIFTPSALRVNVTQETSLASNLDVRVADNQISLASNLRVNITQQLSLPSNLRVEVTATTENVFLPSQLRVKVVDQQLSLASNLTISLQTQIFQPSNLRVKALGIQTSLPSNLDVRILAQQLSLASSLKVIVYSTEDVSLATNLRVNATQEIFLPSNLIVRVSDIQKSLPSNLRITFQSQLYLPSNLRVNATQQLSLVSNIDVRVADNQLSLTSNLKVVAFTVGSVYLPTSLRVKALGQQVSLPSNLDVRVADNQISISSNLKIILTSELSLPTNLRINATQQSSLPTNIRVKVLANQLVKSSNLRVALLTQISVPSSLRVKVIGVQLDISTNLRIKVIGQQISKSTNLKIVVTPQVILPTQLRVKVFDQQVSLPSTLRVIVFLGQTVIVPTNLRVVGAEQTSLPSCLRVDVPPLFQIAVDDTDVGIVRKLMAQAGREVIRVRDDDILPVFYSGSSSHLYTDFQDIMDVQHIRLVDDIYHSGTNYLQGSTIYDKEGRIDIGLTLPANTDEVLITYATRDGLDDEVIQLNIDMAKWYLQSELWRDILNFSGSSTYEQMAKWTLYSIATYWCILGMNSSNAIQSGYNYRIAEFEIQTKLWGEGMIAETLLMKYWERSDNMIKALKLFESNPEAPIYVVNRGKWKRLHFMIVFLGMQSY